MNSFFDALYDLFIAEPHNDFYNAVSGRITYGEAIEGCSFPYAVYFGLSVTPENTFTEKIDDLSFQINIYSTISYSQAGLIQDYCISLLDNTEIEINGTNVVILKEMETPPYKDDEKWAAIIEFQALIQK